MFGNRNFASLLNLFAEQFEPKGAVFHYRKSSIGGPIQVSREERDRFLADFDRHLRWSSWLLVGSVIALIVLKTIFLPQSDGADPTYLEIGGPIALFLASWYWAWNAPARALHGRPVLGQPRRRQEMLQRRLAGMSYWHIALPVPLAAILLWLVSADTDLHRGWGLFWLALAAAVMVAVARHLYLKWRAERG